ncbi:MAG: efflux RND transporter periplasmic adaptor subunit, partial [Pseudomonadota bacterium]
MQQALPVTVITNGTVVPLQAVDIRAQINSTVQAIHFKEGQTVNQGDLLFTLDNRTEDAAQKRAEAQATKSRNDYANAERALKRQRDLYDQKFISPAGLDTVVNQADLSKGQLAVDEASAEVARVAKTLTEIRAPFKGRTGAINIRVGSLVQPTGTALVTISQIDPIAITFALPERELPYVQQAFAKGDVPISAELAGAQKQTLVGKLSFVESTIDTASGTIPMKATFANNAFTLWPGMFVNISAPTRIIAKANVIPVQAVQTGPERKFVYVVSTDNKASMQPVEVLRIQSGLAVVTGVAPGTRIVVEGAQNVRPNGAVVEGTKTETTGGVTGEKSKSGNAEKSGSATPDKQSK